MSQALAEYVPPMLVLDAARVKAEAAGAEGEQMLAALVDYTITTAAEYETCAGVLKDVKGQLKFIDEERKVSVTPLNDEVKRVNDWYRPARESREKVVAHLSACMSVFVKRQRAEEARLLAESAAAAKAALAAAAQAATLSESGTFKDREAFEETAQVAAEASAHAGALVQAAAAVEVPKVKGMSDREVFTFTVVNPSKLPREFLQPDMKAIGAWVKAHGDKNVPAGVEVQRDVRFTNR